MNASSANQLRQLSFVFYGERPALDFANTLRRRKDPLHPTVDLLHDRSDFASWLNQARRATSWARELPELVETPMPINQESVTALREAVLLLAEHSLGMNTLSSFELSSTIEVLNEWSTRRPLLQLDTQSFSPHLLHSKESDLRKTLAKNLELEQALGFVAADAVALFGTNDRQRLKICGHERCGILFEDRSNGLRRQWCSMKDCGNRAKARRYSHNK
ncbi:CGNR zinc finger domain-containing protein [Corynebacterium macclintockiae]|uniref:CGNR zinc finger domain-containing protein n=1 Tax=Corynebacterium macclintockiae TaxID=2913501 RepID=UPI0009B84046|nr:CGNR zinc finger domain-containing protein [Corynebacterium macclintockiae]MDK8870967.1 CGNR zinc finger domain-containing protein [Corynebacterium macclintockiae]